MCFFLLDFCIEKCIFATMNRIGKLVMSISDCRSYNGAVTLSNGFRYTKDTFANFSGSS